jgi:hypothetical protein
VAKDSANNTITVGAIVKFVGTVVAITEPANGIDNVRNIWVIPNNVNLKDNENNQHVTPTGKDLQNSRSRLFDASQLTLGR